MLNKIVLGTANFTSPYGVLNNGSVIDAKTVTDIFSYAHKQGINIADTAFAYGNIYAVLENLACLSELKFISKFSVMDEYAEVDTQLRNTLTKYSLPNFYGLLVHDPVNIEKVDPKALAAFLYTLKSESVVGKIGVSAYDLDDVKKFSDIIIPDLIQIPVNPLNQRFICDEFITFVTENNIEVHARSLFLQGVLLANELPEKLSSLKEIWQRFNNIVGHSVSRLNTVLSWANSHTWIDKWVLGVTSVDDLQTIVAQCSEIMKAQQSADIFQEFKYLNNPLIDPRNWSRV